MNDLAQQMQDASLEVLAAEMARAQPGSQRFAAAQGELFRRQIIAQQDAVKAQENAAKYTRDNARWMFWSVVAVAISSIVTLILQIWERH